MTGRRITKVGFLLQAKKWFIFRHLALKKSLRRFIAEYIPDVRTTIS